MPGAQIARDREERPWQILEQRDGLARRLDRIRARAHVELCAGDEGERLQLLRQVAQLSLRLERLDARRECLRVVRDHVALGGMADQQVRAPLQG